MKGRPGEKLVRLTWVKACECHPATSTTHRTVMQQVDDRTVFVHHPGPVCDVCDTPWKLAPRPRR